MTLDAPPELAAGEKARAPDAAQSVQDRAHIETAYEASPIVVYWAKAYDDVPQWWSPARDVRLRTFWKEETVLAGAVFTFQSKIKTTSWKLSGPPRQVTRYQELLANAEYGAGWGVFVGKLVEDFLTQDNGAWMEILGPGDPKGPIDGPITGLAHLDAGRVYRTGNLEYPVVYHSPLTGRRHLLHHTRVHNLTSMPSTQEEMYGVGYSAVSRVMAAAKILVYVADYKQEKLGGRPHRGIIYGQGFTKKQVEEALAVTAEQANNLGLLRYMPAAILTSPNPGVETALSMLDLASLPDHYDEQVTFDTYIDVLAIGFGVDRNEFAPVRGQGLGSGKESTVQAKKARGKGPAEFYKELERGLNWKILPASTAFEFDNQDDEADKEQADLKAAKVSWINSLSIPAEKKHQLYADEGLIPSEWLEEDLTPDRTAFDADPAEVDPEIPAADAIDATADDVEQAEPDGEKERGARPGFFRRLGAWLGWREKSVNEIVREYEAALTRFAFEALNDRAGALDYRRAHKALIRKLAARAYDEGLREGGVDPADADEDDERAIRDWVASQLPHVDDFAAWLAATANAPEARAALKERVAYWVESLAYVGALGRANAKKNMMLTFAGDDGKESCPECQRYKGQRHRLKWWLKKELVPGIPGTESFSCHGYNCEHFLQDDDGNRVLPDR